MTIAPSQELDTTGLLVRSVTRQQVYRILLNPFKDDREWSLQGLGMLRTYLDEAKTLRLHLWHSAYRVPGVTMLHTHPWDFSSLIVAGRVHQYRYTVAKGKPNYKEQKIQCGVGGGPCDVPVPVCLVPDARESYFAGDQYQQDANEIHESLPEDGSCTIVARRFHADTETASVFFPVGDDSWVSAEPRPAEEAEVADITSYALATWF